MNLILAFLIVAGEILTPAAPRTPRINGARVCGNRPGTEFIYRIPATGDRPMTFSVDGLPKGLKLDPEKGIIRGTVKKSGSYRLVLHAKNALGACERELRLEIGDNCLALTPPLGWNSWNCMAFNFTQEDVTRMADAMVSSGLADYGWSYINLDDGWQGRRDPAKGGLQPNDKFPDMKALVEHIHSLGLRAGIYSGPWVATYGGYAGSYCDNAQGLYPWIEDGLCKPDTRLRDPSKTAKDYNYPGKYSFVKQDVRQWAEWGFDYLKYDWFTNDLYHVKEMYDALAACGRSIVYSTSNQAPFLLAPEYAKYVQCWRTTKDIYDNWESMSAIGFSQGWWAAWRSPGHWPDADMLVVGRMAWWHKESHPSGLTPDEQYTHISLWALLSSPMLIGCDLTALDDFTKGLLTNSEVIDINQDPLGAQAALYNDTEGCKIYVKPLEDGSLAVGLFNTGDAEKEIGFKPRGLGFLENVVVRDVWRQQDIRRLAHEDEFRSSVAPHGVVLLNIRIGE